MMKKSFKVLIIGFVFVLTLLLLCGCDYGDNKKQEFETEETRVDFSIYNDHGSFGEEGITWVKKSDYSGVCYGYIDRDGNYIMPLTSKIVRAENFRKGLAVIWYTCDLMGNGDCAIINTEGKVLATFEMHARTDRWHLNNGNIYLGLSTSASMFCVSTSEFVTVPLIDTMKTSPSDGYHEGLLLTYGYYPKTNGEKGVRYIDENGKIVLHLEKTSSYYRSIRGASVFSGGKATVFFIGQDRELYKVTIDKTGKWLDEPVPAREEETYWGLH